MKGKDQLDRLFADQVGDDAGHAQEAVLTIRQLVAPIIDKHGDLLVASSDIAIESEWLARELS